MDPFWHPWKQQESEARRVLIDSQQKKLIDLPTSQRQKNEVGLEHQPSHHSQIVCIGEQSGII